MYLHCTVVIFQKSFHLIKWKENGLYEYAYDFSVDYDNIEIDDILEIYKYLRKNHDVK